MRFDEDDIALARAVASQCAVAITNAKLYARAIEGAHVTEQMRLAGGHSAKNDSRKSAVDAGT